MNKDIIIKKIKNNEYKNYISLGYFCSVALELEKYGFRNLSMPFDWTITDFEGVLKSIKDKFYDYFNTEYYYQNKNVKSRYYNSKYKMWFFHDFDNYKSLNEQISSVKEKYMKRIDNFYNLIIEPTLFIRYISDESKINDKSKELVYIEKNEEIIESLIKAFNNKNDILYIINDFDDNNKIIDYYCVKKDKGDVVCRAPFDNIVELKLALQECCYSNKENNLEFYKKKVKNENKMYKKITRKILNMLKKIKKEYVHEKLCD